MQDLEEAGGSSTDQETMWARPPIGDLNAKTDSVGKQFFAVMAFFDI